MNNDERQLEYDKAQSNVIEIKKALETVTNPVIIEVLQRQIPKRVIFGEDSTQYCPNCGARVHRNYCQNCGQNLDY